MRLPRMTTRRWMVAVAVVALSFGGYRQVIRLRRERHSRLARARWHAGAEADYRRLIAAITGRPARRRRADQVPTSPALTAAELDRAFRRQFALPAERSVVADMLKARAEYSPSRLPLHRRRADYHAELARKYTWAASRPWLPVEPDPPVPQ
jgi:hypothetical protein